MRRDQDFRGGLSLAEKRGEQRGEQRGKRHGEELGRLLEACEALGVELTEARRAYVDGLDPQALADLRRQIKASRAWPREE
jgi:hypothetical protein